MMTVAIKERPAHVDPSRVIDFDFYHDRRFAEMGDMHAAMNRIAEEEGRGIFWTPRNGGHWFINDYELLFDAARDTGLFSSQRLTLPALPEGMEPRVIPVSLDPPEHTAYRLPLMKAFAPAKVKELEPWIRTFADELIDAVAADGKCDFVDAIAEPMPVIIFMKFMGLDTSRMKEFRTWVYDMLSNDDERRMRSHKVIEAMLLEEIARHRANPQDDMISRLIDGTVDGRPIADDELLAYCLLLFAAGLDTVANSLSFTMQHLARDAALQDRLRSQPEMIPEAVEEFLRLYAVANIVRVVGRDGEFGGVQLRAGERVLFVLPTGNYDPQRFPDPAKFDLDREDKAHISFNAGPHRCVGSHLARLELTLMLEKWFDRMPNVSIEPGYQPGLRGGQVMALSALPIVWDSSAVRR
jgi:cytochrome P450